MAAESALSIAVVRYLHSNPLTSEKSPLPMMTKDYFQSNFADKGWNASVKICLRVEASHYRGLRQAYASCKTF